MSGLQPAVPVGQETRGAAENKDWELYRLGTPTYKSPGWRPVFLAILDSITGPISSCSWNYQVYSGQPIRGGLWPPSKNSSSASGKAYGIQSEFFRSHTLGQDLQGQ